MRAPVDRVIVTPHGSWNFYRAKTGRAHAGVDLGGPRGTAVYAPEAMRVVAVATDDKSPPLSGYGPGSVMALGRSGVVHILGHLLADHGIVVGRRFYEGDLVGRISGLQHVHWEVRRPDRAPWPRSTRIADTFDPLTLVEPTSPDVPDDESPVRQPDGPVRRPSGGARAGGGLVVLALLLLLSANARRK